MILDVEVHMKQSAANDETCLDQMFLQKQLGIWACRLLYIPSEILCKVVYICRQALEQMCRLVACLQQFADFGLDLANWHR